MKQIFSLSAHCQAAAYQETAFELSEPFGLVRLSVEALEFGLHIFMG